MKVKQSPEGSVAAIIAIGGGVLLAVAIAASSSIPNKPSAHGGRSAAPVDESAPKSTVGHNRLGIDK
jgi:hypothetical protein